MSDKMLAYCGLNCAECGAYIAKQTDDDDLRVKTAREWSRPGDTVSPEDINCDGCKSETGVLFGWCMSCGVRACASGKGVTTCAHCDEFGCDTLGNFLKMSPDPEGLRKKLDQIRTSLT